MLSKVEAPAGLEEVRDCPEGKRVGSTKLGAEVFVPAGSTPLRTWNISLWSVKLYLTFTHRSGLSKVSMRRVMSVQSIGVVPQCTEYSVPIIIGTAQAFGTSWY